MACFFFCFFYSNQEPEGVDEEFYDDVASATQKPLPPETPPPPSRPPPPSSRPPPPSSLQDGFAAPPLPLQPPPSKRPPPPPIVTEEDTNYEVEDAVSLLLKISAPFENKCTLETNFLLYIYIFFFFADSEWRWSHSSNVCEV